MADDQIAAPLKTFGAGGSDPGTADEAVLAARALEGDEDAFAALLHPHLPRALRLARRILRQPEDAEDLVQDAVLRALMNLNRFDRSRPFAPWFLRLLFNLGLNARAAIARRTHDSLDVRELPAGETTLDDAERAEIRTAIDSAVRALSPRQRTILMLYEVDGYSGREIAEMLDLTPETVRWHLHVARKALRPELRHLRP